MIMPFPDCVRVVCRTSDGRRYVRHDLEDGSAIVVLDDTEWDVGIHGDHLDGEDAASLAEETGIEAVYLWPARHGRADLTRSHQSSRQRTDV